jgi:uncharacterized membrane protein
MSWLLLNFRNTVIAGLVLAVLFIIGYGLHGPSGFDGIFWQGVFRWIHVLSGILWIGLLYYFNFVQTRKMPDIPAELKPAISRYIAPEAMFWFRWSALSTVVAGVILASLRGYIWEVLSFGLANGYDKALDTQYTFLGVGVWLAIIMFLNVWGIIWPNQKIVLGFKEADADAKARAGKTATLASRVNMLLSLPMLVAMTMSQTVFG